ncbi:MAG: hypothetical protein ICV60_21335 [Pyrinomonadaceae bacterium]|nr:hypothetical protein [Pyrinomonadaceae bacterium]
MKKFFAATLLALMVGLGTPAAFATEGTAESPGVTSTQPGTAESPGYTGTAESPGFMDAVIIYMDAII